MHEGPRVEDATVLGGVSDILQGWCPMPYIVVHRTSVSGRQRSLNASEQGTRSELQSY